MRCIKVEAATPAAFAPFGDCFECLKTQGRSVPLSNPESINRADFDPQITVSHLAGSVSPVTLEKLERHPLSTQTFKPNT